RTVSQTAQIIESEHVSIWMQNADGTLLPRAFHGVHDPDLVEAAVSKVTAEFLELLGENAEPFLLDPDALSTPYLVAPLTLEDGTRGCIAAAMPDSDPDLLDRPLRLIAGLAHQAKLAITNANSFEN